LQQIPHQHLSSAQQQLLLVVGHQRAELAARISSLSTTEWETLLNEVKAQHLETFFYQELRRLGGATAVPSLLRDQLVEQHRQQTYRNFQLYQEFFRIHDALAAAGMPAIPLKGMHVAATVYENIGERAVGDLDILIPLDALELIAEHAAELGYTPTKPVMLETVTRTSHHLPPFVHREKKILVEWHWHIAPPQRHHHLAIDPFWRRARIISLAGKETLTFSPEDLLCHTAHHLSYQHEFSFGMRSLCDIRHIVACYRDSLDWDAVVARTRTWQLERGFYLAFRIAREFFAADIPTAVLEALRPADIDAHILELAATQLFVDPHTFSRQGAGALLEIRNAKGWRAKAFNMKEAVFPSEQKMFRRYGISPGRLSAAGRITFHWRRLLPVLLEMGRRRWQGTEMVTPIVQRRSALGSWMNRRNND